MLIPFEPLAGRHAIAATFRRDMHKAVQSRRQVRPWRRNAPTDRAGAPWSGPRERNQEHSIQRNVG